VQIPIFIVFVSCCPSPTRDLLTYRFDSPLTFQLLDRLVLSSPFNFDLDNVVFSDLVAFFRGLFFLTRDLVCLSEEETELCASLFTSVPRFFPPFNGMAPGSETTFSVFFPSDTFSSPSDGSSMRHLSVYPPSKRRFSRFLFSNPDDPPFGRDVCSFSPTPLSYSPEWFALPDPFEISLLFSRRFYARPLRYG